jgi:preprotein translocase subunit SecF
MALQLIPNNTKIDFVGRRFITFFVALILAVLGTSGYFNGLNFGVDFKGGHVIEVHMDKEPDLTILREKLNALNLGEVIIQEIGTPKDLMIKIELQEGDDTAQGNAIQTIKNVLGAGQEYRKVATVGPKVGGEMVENAIKAVALALAAMLVYIAIRFEWQFAACAIIALAHDCLALLALFSWAGLEFNETSVIAILITAGYSINDTIVIFDRIRENLRKFKKLELKEIINKSLNETLSRTIMTATTTLLALTALYFMAGPVISAFSFPIIIGITVGSFSSICLASPLLLYMHLPRDDNNSDTTEAVKLS